MKNADKLFEIEALTENLSKHIANNNLLRIKILYFISQYENLSVSMIIEKLGIKKSNFALMSKELENEGLIISKQGEIDKRCRMISLTDAGKTVLDGFLGELSSALGNLPNEVENAICTLCNFLNKKI